MPRMLLPFLLGLVLLGPLGCGKAPSNTAWVEQQVVTDEALGISLEVPLEWRTEREDGAVISSGPLGNDAYYTTITIQSVPRTTRGLGEQLMDAYSPAAELSGFKWIRREPWVVSTFPAMRYALRFDLHETPRQKMGVLVDTPRGLLDISYGSPEDLFNHSIPVFEHALSSISLF